MHHHVGTSVLTVGKQYMCFHFCVICCLKGHLIEWGLKSH